MLSPRRSLLSVFRAGSLFVALFIGLMPAQAQNYSQTARSFYQSVQTVGMGDAAIALPSPRHAFFYNPAHLAYIPALRPTVQFFGVRASISSNVQDQIDFFNDELEPAIDDGLENLPPAELEALYDRAFELGKDRTMIGLGVVGPSIMMNTKLVGIGGGIFANGFMRYRYTDGGAGIPLLDLLGVADLLVVAGGGLNLGVVGIKGLSVGGSVKYTQRFLTIKNTPLDLIGEDEPIHLLSGNSVGIDLGVLYELPFLTVIPGKLMVAVVVYDIAGQQFDYGYNRTISGDYDPSLAAQEIAQANAYMRLSTSYRIGASWLFPTLGGFLRETGVSVEYLGIADPLVDQVFMANMRIGAQVRFPFFAVRAGISQGYPSIGAGIYLGFLKLDYALYGIEEGRIPGQLPGYNHAVELTFGIF